MFKQISILLLALQVASVHAADTNENKRVLCFGDSITAVGEWVARVGTDPGIETINAGKGGRKAAQAKAALADYLKRFSDLDAIIMFLGVNDLPARDKRPGDVKVAACVENMRATVDLALTRFKARDIILVAPCTVNPATMNAVNLKKGYDITPPLLEQMAEAYEALAEEKGLSFISLLNVVSKENYKDGLHPNSAGDVEIANAISTHLATHWSPAAEPEKTVAGWPTAIERITYRASCDDSDQPMLVYAATAAEKRPLLVGLHTWGGSYTQAGNQTVYARWCIENDWHFIHPQFRGPNWTPDACGSDKAVQDIIDAVAYMKTTYNVDTDRIYLAGVSGGGYASLLMAGRAPEIWAGVSAWVPISDIRAWWEQKTAKPSKYATDIEKAVGGRPDLDEAAAQECIKRSPVTYLDRARGVNLDINAGVHDGHEGGSVPFTHSLYAFNRVVPQADRLDAEFIDAFYEHQALPDGAQTAEADPLYGKRQPIFRKASGNTRVTIFEGGHDIVHPAALNWLATQRKGKPANWNVTALHDLNVAEDESESGK